MSAIFKSGFSRVPICGDDGMDDVVGLMLVKDLIFIDPDDETPIANFLTVFGRTIQTVWPDQGLHEALQVFRQGKGHLAIVRDVNNKSNELDPFYFSVGIITLEDLIGELLGEDILDETDRAGKEPRDIDLARLITLIGSHGVSDSSQLDMTEAKVIANYLIVNVPQVSTLFGGKKKMKRIIDFILHCPVYSYNSHESDSVERNVLYRRGESSDTCTMILHGKVTVKAGKDEFTSELGAWNLLGADALTAEVWSYTAIRYAVYSLRVKYFRMESFPLTFQRRSHLTVSSAYA
jgi:metal transporter CNNM